MIIFLYGKDAYRAKEKIKEIVSKYKEVHKSGLNLKHFDCSLSGFSFKEALYGSSQFSMFKEKKLYIFLSPFSRKKEFEEEIENLGKSEDIFLFYEAEASEKDKLFKALEEKASLQAFNCLTGLKLKGWIRKEFEGLGKEIDERALNLFALLTGNDLWRVKNEVVKVASFSDGKRIKEEDIRELIKPDVKNEIFKTIDAIAGKNRKEALKLIKLHMEEGESPLYLLTMIAYQFRNVLIVKDLIERGEDYAGISKKAGMHPFVFKKTYSQSLKFSFPELKKIYRQLVQADLDIKTGKADKEAAVELLLAGI